MAAENGQGPPNGGPVISPTHPYGGGLMIPRSDDPAFQPPSDPTRDRGALRDRARVIHREIPNVIVQQGWAVQDVRSALTDLVVGLFDRPSQLHDAIAGDSRVQSAMRSRSGGLLGRPIRFKVPVKLKGDAAAEDCLAAWERHWPQMAAEPALLDMLETAHSLGFSYSQLIWDTSRPVWKPYLQTFNARYSYYLWPLRQHTAVTLDGSVPVTGGDGHWVLHAPYGQYRGWMRGSLRALAQWWLARNYALRDWARYCERHGFPILLADMPFGADPTAAANYQQQLTTIGQESVLLVPAGPDLQRFGKYDLRYLEPRDQNWQAFKALIEQCNDEITLALLGQNLTSQVREGSLAAARVHADVRQAILEADARALAKTIYNQIIRPFAALNFGDAKYAPKVEWDVSAPEDLETKAKTLQAFAQSALTLRNAGFALENVERFAKRFGIAGLKLREVPPLQIEAQSARATGEVADDSSEEEQAEDLKDSEDDKSGDEDEEKDDESAKTEEVFDELLEAQAQSSAGLRRLAKRLERTRDDLARGFSEAVAGIEGRSEEATRRLADEVSRQTRAVMERVERASQRPAPRPERTFAERHAAFLADLKDYRDLGSEPDLEALAAHHDVPIEIARKAWPKKEG